MAQKNISFFRFLFQATMRWVTLLVCLLAIACTVYAFLDSDSQAAAPWLLGLTVAMNLAYWIGTYRHYQLLKKQFPHYLTDKTDAA